MPTSSEAKKKKLRIRNRPKNKANRERLAGEINNNNVDLPDNMCSGENGTGANTTTISVKPIVSQQTAAAATTTPPPPTKRVIAESNEEALKIIQQLLRQKLLKAQAKEAKESKQSKENGDSVAPKPAKETNNRDGKKENKTNSDEAMKANSEPSTSKSTGKQHELSEKIKEKCENTSTSTSASAPEPKVKKSKSKDKLMASAGSAGTTTPDKNVFIQNLQKKMENMMINGSPELPSKLLGNLQQLFNQAPVSDVETSDDEEEYIEYIYKPRQYFIVSLCNHCKMDLRDQDLLPCDRCGLTYYCSMQHMRADQAHRQLCYGLRQVADSCGTHIFHKSDVFSAEQFRSYRIITIRKVEAAINRTLTATEQEVILFPRICCEPKCREYRFKRLIDCEKCGQVAYCRDRPEHLNEQHKLWCRPYQLFQAMVMFQEKFGRLDPSLPSKILKELPVMCSSTKQILNKLSFDMHDDCEYAALSQISTGPLTAWYALKLCGQLRKNDTVVVHLIGAEIEFEVDILHKWELFFTHITPSVKHLHVVFVGPELNPRNISFEQLKKTKCCRFCRKAERTVNYYFENKLYHEYCTTPEFLKPDLICFFNAGLYRSTGYMLEDTWPETILAASNLKCPVVVTSYTEYEAPLDMTRFVQESNRRLNVVLPPIVNPFASDKPERNFISDDETPLMFKNYYCFVVE